MSPRSIASRTRLPVKTRLACALAACLLVQSPLLLAQSTSATLRGRVTADAAPASGASVTATNVATGFTRTVQSSSGGDYVLNGLPPGTYRVDVSAGGKTSSRTVVLQVGQTATIGLGVGGAAPTTDLGAVIVTGVALPETKTSEIATYVTTKQIEALPQGSRNFLAFADTVPGMAFTTSSNGTSSKLRGGAQNSNGINVFIDGVGQKNYVVKGGITGQDSSRGNPFPQMGIAEYKVITSNYKAELDQLSSAAVVAVTRSGTNEFHGDAFFDYSNQSMRESTPREIRDGRKADSLDKQYGFAVGGPIIKDIAHFFFTYEHKDFTTPNTFSPGPPYTIDTIPSQFQDQARATTSSPFQEDLYFAKLDWAIGDDHLLELSARRRSEDELTGLGGSTLNDHGTLKSGDETRVDLRWQWNAQNFLNDAHLTYEDATFGPRPATIGPGYVLTTNDPNRLILSAGGGRDFQDKGQKGWALQDDLTFTTFDWNGGHTIKAGVKLKSVEVNAFEQQPFNAQFFYDINRDLAVPYQVQFSSTQVNGVDRNITSRNKQFGAYIQDDWEVNDHLLLNLGVRWDYEKSPGFLDYMTPAGVAASLRAWPNLHAAGVDYDIENYISDGNNRKAFKGAFQPRVGFSYDLDADQRHVVFGGAGRSYDRNLWDYLAIEQSKSSFPPYFYQFNTAGHPCSGPGCLAWNSSYLDQANLDALTTANGSLGAEVDLINNDLKTPYSDQFSLGMRNVFSAGGRAWNSSVTLLRVLSHDGIVFTWGSRYPSGSYRDPNCVGATWGCGPANIRIPGYGQFVKIDNGIETKLDSLLVSLEKPYTKDSPWNLNFAYTYSNARENKINAYESDEHFEGDYPTSDAAGFRRSVGLPRHRLVVTGFIDGPWGMNYSAKLSLASPKPQQALNCHDGGSFLHCYWDPFTPGYAIGNKQLDLAVQKTVDITEDMHLRFRLDLLNAFNWHNWTDYDNWRGDPTNANPNFGNRNGVGTEYPPRMIKATVGFTW